MQHPLSIYCRQICSCRIHCPSNIEEVLYQERIYGALLWLGASFLYTAYFPIFSKLNLCIFLKVPPNVWDCTDNDLSWDLHQICFFLSGWQPSFESRQDQTYRGLRLTVYPLQALAIPGPPLAFWLLHGLCCLQQAAAS